MNSSKILKNNQNNLKEDEIEEDEDEEEEELTEWSLNDEKDFLRTLGALKSHDPEIYQTEVKFFKENEEEKKSDDSSKNNNLSLQQPKMTLKEYEQKLIIERGGKLSEDEEDEIEENDQLTNGLNKNDLELKNEFKNALNSDDESDDEDLLKKRIKTEEEKAKEDEDFYEWIKGENQMEVKDKHLRKLKERWTKNDKELGEDERFLRDFLLNKKYLGETNDEGGIEERIPTYEEITKDEQEEDLADQFEQKYNFRFEEPDQEFLKQYPRTINEALRKKESKRHKKLLEEKEAKKRKRMHVEMVEMPFRYRQVVPNSFGLSTDEILNADDRCLNAWAPLSKICQYRDDTEEQKQILYFERKAKNIEKKKKILDKKLTSEEKSEEKQEEKDDKSEEKVEEEEHQQQYNEESSPNIPSTSNFEVKAKAIKKAFNEQNGEQENGELNQEKIDEKLNEDNQNKRKKRMLLKKSKSNKKKKQFDVTELNKERLKAYGVGTIKKLKSIQFCKKMEEKQKKIEEMKGKEGKKKKKRKKEKMVEKDEVNEAI